MAPCTRTRKGARAFRIGVPRAKLCVCVKNRLSFWNRHKAITSERYIICSVGDVVFNGCRYFFCVGFLGEHFRTIYIGNPYLLIKRCYYVHHYYLFVEQFCYAAAKPEWCRKSVIHIDGERTKTSRAWLSESWPNEKDVDKVRYLGSQSTR